MAMTAAPAHDSSPRRASPARPAGGAARSKTLCGRARKCSHRPASRAAASRRTHTQLSNVHSLIGTGPSPIGVHDQPPDSSYWRNANSAASKPVKTVGIRRVKVIRPVVLRSVQYSPVSVSGRASGPWLSRIRAPLVYLAAHSAGGSSAACWCRRRRFGSPDRWEKRECGQR